MAKRKSDASNAPAPPSAGKKAKNPGIPDRLDWNADNMAKTWSLITAMEMGDNAKVLFGKKDKSEVSGHAFAEAWGLTITYG